MTTPVVRALSMKFPDCLISVDTVFQNVYNNNPRVDNTLEHHDYLINLDGVYERNPSQHFVESFMIEAGVIGDMRPELWPTKDEKQMIDGMIKDIDRFVVIHARNSGYHQSRNLPYRIWQHLADLVPYTVIFVGAKRDLYCPAYNARDFRGIFKPAALAYLISHSQAFIGVDSGPMHCAATSDVPIVALLTQTPPEIVLPYRHGIKGWKCLVVQSQAQCRGCYSRHKAPVSEIYCQTQDFRCREQWHVDDIDRAMESLLF